MLSSKEIVCPNNLLDLAHKKKGVKVAVVNAGKLFVISGETNDIFKVGEEVFLSINDQEVKILND